MASIFLIFRYDSLTGVPNIQKTLTFEKGCVMFNIGALYTQIACKQVCIIRCMSLKLLHFYAHTLRGAFQFALVCLSVHPKIMTKVEKLGHLCPMDTFLVYYII